MPPLLQEANAGAPRLDWRYAGLGGVSLAIILGIVLATTWILEYQESGALRIDLAGRQRMLHQQHLRQIILASQGHATTHADTRRVLDDTLRALIDGGPALYNLGEAGVVELPPAPTAEIRAKLLAQRDLMARFSAKADAFLHVPKTDPGYAAELNELLRVTDELHRLSNEAVKLLDDHAESMLRSMVTWELAVAVLAFGLGLLFTRHVVQANRALGREVAERQLAEAAVRESEARLQRITDTVPGVVYQYRLSPTGAQSFLYMSRGAEELLGLRAQQALDDFDLVWNLCHPDDRGALHESIEASARSQQPWSHEFRITVQGRVKWVRGSSVPEPPRADGSLVWNGILMDITEQREASERIRLIEEMNRQVLDAIADLVFVKEPSSRLIWANKAFRRYYGMTAGELQGIIDAPFNEPAYTAQYLKDDARVFESGETLDIPQEPITRCDGEVRQFHTVKSPIRDDTGRVVRLVGVARDITERKRVEEALARSERRYALATAEARIGVWDWNLETGEFYLDPNIKAILGYEDREVANDLTAWLEHVHPEDREAAMQAATDHLEGRTTHYVHEHRMLHKNGVVRWILVRGMAHRDGNGNVVRMIGTDMDITDRKEVEEHVRDLHRRYHLLLSSAGEGVYGLDTTGRITFVNPAAARMIGHEVDALVGRVMHDIVHGMRADGSPYPWEDCPICRAFLEGRPQRRDDEVFWRKDGSAFPVSYTSTPIRDEAGTLVGAVVTFQDITERKRGEEVLRRYERIVSSSSDLMAFVDRQYRYLAVNRSYADSFGLEIEEVLGHRVAELLGDDRFKTSIQPHLDRCLAGESVSFQHWIEIPRRGRRYLDVQYSPHRDPDGCVGGVVVNIRDLTELKSAEEALQLTQFAIDHAAVAAFWIDRDGRFFYVNQAACHSLGYAREELLGKGVYDIDPDYPQSKWEEAWEQLKRAGASAFETRHRRKDGTTFSVEVTVNYLRYQEGEFLIAFARDVSERKRAEEELRKSEEKTIAALRQSDSLKSALLSSVSHELRTPLTAIKAMASSAFQRDGRLAAELREEFLSAMNREVDYLNRLVDNLLDMSSIEAGVLAPKREWQLLDDIVEGAIRRLGPVLGERPLALKLADDLPPVFVDGVEVQQVLVNLLDNAVKYSPAGSEVRLEAIRVPGAVGVRVCNTGEGIPEEDLARVFDRFYRVPSNVDRRVRGTGLGLAICRGIVEAHGGTIWCHSVAGADTVFGFTLPLEPGIEEQASPPEGPLARSDA